MHLLRLWLLPLGLSAALLAVAGPAPDFPDPASPVTHPDASVWSISYARTHPGEQAAYLAFLERNWAEARRRAVQDGVVLSCRVFARPGADAADWDVMMVTEYADEAAYVNREAYFTALFARPDWETHLIDGRSGRDLADLVGEEVVLRSVVAGR